MTMRLSIISLAGIARTLVAVGMVSEAAMFLATAADAPRSICVVSASGEVGSGRGFPEVFAAFDAGAGVVCGVRAVDFAAGAALRRGGRLSGGCCLGLFCLGSRGLGLFGLGRRGLGRIGLLRRRSLGLGGGGGRDRCGRGLGLRRRGLLGLRLRAVGRIRARIGRVVGKELVPTRVDGGRIVLEPLVHLLDQPLVLTELRCGTAHGRCSPLLILTQLKARVVPVVSKRRLALLSDAHARSTAICDVCAHRDFPHHLGRLVRIGDYSPSALPGSP